MIERILGPVVSVLLSFVLVALIFGKIFWQPNEYAIVNGGDGFYIQYQMAFHARHGDGVNLSSMNYPYGEVLFLTDAQAAITIVCSWLSKNVIDISPYMVGINNSILLWLIPLATLFLFLTLRALGVNTIIAVCGSLLITFLSPQIMRITGGHLGLGYLFLFPMSIYYLVRFLQGNPWKWGYLVLGACYLFLGLNNPYILLISASLVMTVGGFVFLMNMPKIKLAFIQALKLTAPALIPLVLVLLMIKGLDQVEDRVQSPYGYAVNFAKPESIFLPQKSTKAYELIQPYCSYKKTAVEGWAYVGLSGLISLVAIALLWMVNLFRNRGKTFFNLIGSKELNTLLWASLPILVFSMNFFLYEELREMKWLPALKTFRAPGRFAWVFYYVFTICVIYLFNEGVKYLQKRMKSIFAYLILLPFLFIWITDIYYYLKACTKYIPHKNELSQGVLDSYLNDLKETDINKKNYQAIYLLPSIHLWTDKLVYNTYYHSERNAFPISLATGIPFFNAWLSRMSVSQTLASAQMVSDPLIKRRFDRIPLDERPILLVLGKESELAEGEKSIIAHSDTLFHSDNYTLFKYDPYKNQQDTFWRNAQEVYVNREIKQNEPFLHVSFEEETNSPAFYGKGSKSMAAKETLIWEVELPDDFDYGEKYECSLWVYVDHEHHGMPFIHVTEEDAEKKRVLSSYKWAAHSKDIQDGWLKVSQNIQFNSRTKYLKFASLYDFKTTIDELQVRALGDTSIVELEQESEFLYNNIKIERPEDD